MTAAGCPDTLPAPLDDGATIAVARRFAPRLLFSRYERHFPVDPEAFRSRAWFRFSNLRGRTDATWDSSRGAWAAGDEPGQAGLDVPWPVLTGAAERAHVEACRADGCHVACTASGGHQPCAASLRWCGPVTRPRDGRNLWKARGGDGARGLFLELEPPGWHHRSGDPSRWPPVFFDAYRVAGTRYVAMAYWWFYAYNWHIALQHEGDWEHLTLYFDEAAFQAGGEPEKVFFAAHEHGAVLPWRHRALTMVPVGDGVHVTGFVSTFGHPTHPVPPDEWGHVWSVEWRTWEGALRSLPAEPWALYDGAWGEVGLWKESTGPLGPYFKRRADTVVVTRP